MVIEENLLINFGADIIKLGKNELLFKENSAPVYYYQIRKGKIKLTNFQAGNGEFIQSIHRQGECIEVFFLFSAHNYPVNAIAIENCTILRLERPILFKLLKANFEIRLKFFHHVAERIHFNYILLNSLILGDAASRLLNLLDYVKDNSDRSEHYRYQIPFTRKEISSLTGLRIETVIRTFKRMEKEGIIKIIKGKIFY